MWSRLRRLRRRSYPCDRAKLPATGVPKSRREGLVSVHVDLTGCQVFSRRPLARTQELDAQPFNFLDEHQNCATGCGMFLTPRVSQALAPAP
jgi:hypothetical protein